jgi:heat shock protein HtpX
MTSFFDEIARNRLKSLVLMAIFSLLFAGIIYAVVLLLGGGLFAFILGFALVIIYAAFTYYKGDRLVLAVSKAKEADPKQYQNLYSVVEGLALATQVKMPKVYVIDDPNPNAFATGRRSKPSIAVTTGLLSIMNREELQGVIAHEISHVADNDIMVMTIAIAFAGVIGMIAAYVRMSLMFGMNLGGGRRNGDSGLIVLVALLIGLLAPFFALLIRLAISRKREWMADANGARITRDPAALASALTKIQSYTSKPNAQGVRHANEVTAPMYFSNPFTGKSLMNLFSTHPPIEDRIAKLKQMY